MTTNEVRRIAGVHCECCGRQDPMTDDGYTTCCNELECHGDGIVTWVFEKNYVRLNIPTVRSCCSASAGPFPEGADGAHQDCNDPACKPHATNRRSFR